MKCDFCGYEFTMREAQEGAKCPRCEESRAKDESDKAWRASVSPDVQGAIRDYPGAQPVVVVDLRMSFSSMMWFMVKAALASIPAFIILFVIGSVLAGFGAGLINALR